ncbi:unnamed protein product [Cochlearia groenlandica]
MASQIKASQILSISEIDKGRSFIRNHHVISSFNPIKSFQIQNAKRRIIAFALDNSGSSDNGQELNGDRSGLGSTRLGRIASALGKQLLVKINNARRNFPMKIFLLLLGFYTANALATILGQTGDWDVLVAGIVVAAIEGIGMLMYKKKKKKEQTPSSSSSSSPSVFYDKLESFVVFMNFWKAGVCLGLFVDAFKLGS